jgi:hypothetical protein
VAHRRLTYQEFAHVRRHAVSCRVGVTIDGNGTVRVGRRGATSQRPGKGRVGGPNRNGFGNSGV